MTIEVLADTKNSSTYFAYCHSCDDINEETGDPQRGPLQLSGNGARSLEEAKNQAVAHEGRSPNEHIIIIEGV